LHSLGLRVRYVPVGLGAADQRANDSTTAGMAANRYVALEIRHG
jgi:hypothetical protein